MRTGEIRLSGMGLAVVSGRLPVLGRLVLQALSGLPVAAREGAIFGAWSGARPAQKAVQRALGGPTLVRVRFTDGRLAGHVFDCLTSEKYFLVGSRYEQPLQARLERLIPPGGIVYDVGAHAGYWALLFATVCGDAGHVYAFEPSKGMFERLRQNLQHNDRSAVTAVPAAVSDAEGRAWLADQGSFSRVLAAGEASPDASAITRIRLDDFVYRDGHRPPSFVKIDVEGHAGACLGGAARVLGEARPTLLVELHGPKEAAAVRGILDGHRYTVEKIEPTESFTHHIVAHPR